MKTYGKKKTNNSAGHGDHCVTCHPPGKNLKTRGRKMARQEIETQVEDVEEETK